MNLLSAGAALGVLSAAYVWGWGGTALHASRAGPIQPFLPVMIFAILFGLSMDYQVFLVSRMREEWHRTGSNEQAVRRGLAITGRTITAAAVIMILLFASFLLGSNVVIKQFGLGLAVAVFVDAFLIRMAIVPAVMFIFRRANWWLPARLDRALPSSLGSEAPDELPQKEEAPCGSLVPVAEVWAPRLPRDRGARQIVLRPRLPEVRRHHHEKRRHHLRRLHPQHRRTGGGH